VEIGKFQWPNIALLIAAVSQLAVADFVYKTGLCGAGFDAAGNYPNRLHIEREIAADEIYITDRIGWDRGLRGPGPVRRGQWFPFNGRS